MSRHILNAQYLEKPDGSAYTVGEDRTPTLAEWLSDLMDTLVGENSISRRNLTMLDVRHAYKV